MRRCADTRAQAAIKSIAERLPPQALASIVPEAAVGQLGQSTPAQPHILDILQDALNFHNSALTTTLCMVYRRYLIVVARFCFIQLQF